MEWWQAVVLGIVQGLTEFLPISSSAHLIVVPLLLGWPQPGLAFDMALHLGTLMAVLLFFWRDLSTMALALPRACVTGRLWQDRQARLALLLILGCAPATIAGLLWQHTIESTFYSEAGLRQGLLVIAVMMIVLALALGLAERISTRQRELKDIGIADAAIIGLAQAVALVPGVSRSGSTITAALFLGLSRPAAARFSFLLGTPVIFGAAIKPLISLASGGLTSADRLAFVAGFASSAIVGYLCIKYLIRYLQTRTTSVFIVYRLIAGCGLLVFSLFR